MFTILESNQRCIGISFVIEIVYLQRDMLGNIITPSHRKFFFIQRFSGVARNKKLVGIKDTIYTAQVLNVDNCNSKSA